MGNTFINPFNNSMLQQNNYARIGQGLQQNNKSPFQKFWDKNGEKILTETPKFVDTATSSIPSLDKTKNSNDALVEQGRELVSNALLQSGNPFAMAAGAAVKIVDKTGGFTDASKGLGGGLDAANIIASFALPGFGYFAPKTESMELDQQIQSSSAYTGLANNLQEIQGNADAKLLFGRSKANNMIAEARSKQNRTSNILADAEMAKASSMSSIHSIGAKNQLAGGYSMVAKKGAKLYKNLDKVKKIILAQDGNKIKTRSLEELIEYSKEKNPRFIQRLSKYPKGIEFTNESGNKEKGSHLLSYSTIDNGDAIVYPLIQEINGELVLLSNDDAIKTAKDNNDYLIMTAEEADNFTKNYKQGWPEFFQKFKEGGSINIIPDGALHARKHHLEDIDDKYKEITSKGIPVISESEDGEIIQHAEVEKEELILRLEVTQKLEKLAKENTDESALEAGKLLVDEILYNTEDKTNKLI